MTVRTILVDHLTIDVAHLGESRRFYEAALAPLGAGRALELAVFHGRA